MCVCAHVKVYPAPYRWGPYTQEGGKIPLGGGVKGGFHSSPACERRRWRGLYFGPFVYVRSGSGVLGWGGGASLGMSGPHSLEITGSGQRDARNASYVTLQVFYRTDCIGTHQPICVLMLSVSGWLTLHALQHLQDDLCICTCHANV